MPEPKTRDLEAKIAQLQQRIKELEDPREYQFRWKNFDEDFDADSDNAYPILTTKGRAFPDIELDPDDDHNVLIEGDNYHALSILNYTHRGKIDVIYIDPPYNTGNDGFRYKDKRVSDTSSEGVLLPRDHPYRHSMWLSFMAKRLRIARNLLTDAGVIFISIDDNEFAQIKLLCDDIFGETNFIDCLPRLTKKGGKSTNTISKNHDYVLVYQKTADASLHPLPHNDAGYKFKDQHFDERGAYKLNQTLDYDTLGYVNSLDYPISIEGKILYPGSFDEDQHLARKAENPKDGFRWRWSQKKVVFGLANDFLVLKQYKDKPPRIYSKTYQFAKISKNGSGKYFVEYSPRSKPLHSIDLIENVYSNDNAKKELKRIFPKSVFDYPKPTSLINLLLRISTRKDSTVLDFMAGSGTTGHAVLQLNQDDGGRRKFILVTNNENNICEDVTYQRLDKVMRGYTTATGEQVAGLGGNLKYLKTGFVAKQVAYGMTDEAKLALTEEANQVLALKENCFTPLQRSAHFEILCSPTRALGIYFSEDKLALDEFLAALEAHRGDRPAKAYVFSWEKGAYSAGFDDYPAITCDDIPEPLIEVYSAILGV